MNRHIINACVIGLFLGLLCIFFSTPFSKLLSATTFAEESQRLPWIAVSQDGEHFIEQETKEPFYVWGVNYDSQWKIW